MRLSSQVSLLVITSAEGAINNHRQEQETPSDDAGDDTLSISGAIGPKLRGSNTACTISDEEHAVYQSSLGVAFDVRRGE